MTQAFPTPDSFLPLTPAVFNILLALADGEKLQAEAQRLASQAALARRKGVLEGTPG